MPEHTIMPEQDNRTERPLCSYELIIHGNKDAFIQKGEPHLILRRKPLNEPEAALEDTPSKGEHDMNSESEANLSDEASNTNEAEKNEENQESVDDAGVESSGQVADYIASLMHHVPDDVSRVVDAIIEEESKLPKGLPTLDEAMSAIYSNAASSEAGGDGLEQLPDTEQAPEAAPAKAPGGYTKKVEYEDR